MMEILKGPHLVYFADPMCSWCWGFSPVVAAIGREFGEDLPIHPVMGGLRPYTKAPASDSDIRTIRSHWEHVRERTLQPFDHAFFERKGFVYDTEPGARAVVVMRRAGAAAALEGLRRIQAAFYAQNRDVTDLEELVAIAAATGFDPGASRAEFAGEDALRETRQDFALARRVGITGFPTMLAGIEKQYAIVTVGYREPAEGFPALRKWRASVNRR